MKKIMVLASAVAMACAASAASFQWGFGSDAITDINGNYMGEAVPGYAYLFLGTVTASDTAFDFSNATLLAQAGQNELFQYGELSDTISSPLLTSTDAGQAYSLILFEDQVADLSKFEGNYLLTTGVSERGEIPGQTVEYYAKFNDFTEYGAGDWKTMANVPEPTSGLLLLLGMAGLALKRKNA